SHLSARFCVLLSLFAVGAWPFALVISPAQFIGTIATPAYAAIIKEVYPDDQRGRILSITRAAIVVAQVFSPLLAGWLLGFAHYRFIFRVSRLVGMAAALVFTRIQPERPAPASVAPATEEAVDPGLQASVAQRLRETFAFVFSTL